MMFPILWGAVAALAAMMAYAFLVLARDAYRHKLGLHLVAVSVCGAIAAIYVSVVIAGKLFERGGL